MSLADLILAADDKPIEKHEVPEWGAAVFLRAMSGHERSQWSASAFDDQGELLKENMRARLLVHCLCDEAGAKLFKPDQATALEEKNAAVLQRLFERAGKLNGLAPDSVDGAEKNS